MGCYCFSGCTFTRSATVDPASNSNSPLALSSHQDIMNRENSTRLPYMQVEYIDDICYPLYKVCYFCRCGCMRVAHACVCMFVTERKPHNIVLICCPVLSSSALISMFTSMSPSPSDCFETVWQLLPTAERLQEEQRKLAASR